MRSQLFETSFKPACEAMGYAAEDSIGERMDELASRMISEATARITESVISPSFEVERPATVPSDNSEHKVTVAVIDLQPKKHYETVPSKSTYAFLVALVVNDSASPLLPGCASIYLDNSFVAKTDIKSVSPNEHFTCCLGVDPAIKTIYNPMHKYTEQAGLLTKAASTMHERKIVIKNTKASSFQITVREHVPKSTDERIKIKLFSPEVSPKEINTKKIEPTLGAYLDENHNLEWTLSVEPNSEEELLLKWSMEYLHGQTVTFNEVFPN